MKEIIKYGAVLLVGFGAGFFTAKIVYKRYYEDLANEEIDQVRNIAKRQVAVTANEFVLKNDKQKEVLNLITESIKPADKEDIRKYHKIVTNYGNKPLSPVGADWSMNEAHAEYCADRMRPTEEEDTEEDNETDEEDNEDPSMETPPSCTRDSIEFPYTIPTQSFVDEFPEFAKITLTYYDEDDTLADENENPIDNIAQVIGDEALTQFGSNPDDENVIYVRNEVLSIDYEVIRSNLSYKRDVLGFKE